MLLLSIILFIVSYNIDTYYNAYCFLDVHVNRYFKTFENMSISFVQARGAKGQYLYFILEF